MVFVNTTLKINNNIALDALIMDTYTMLDNIYFISIPLLSTHQKSHYFLLITAILENENLLNFSENHLEINENGFLLLEGILSEIVKI